jgi:hypothetical protein
MNLEQALLETYRKYGTEFTPLSTELKLGISRDFFSGKLPLNGLRHPPESDTCGWYLWAGEEMSSADDYFEPVHFFHLLDRMPEICRFLGLPAGWRFLVAGEYEDAWFDPHLQKM